MESSFDKCAKLIRKCRIRETLEGIGLPNQERIRALEEKENYKHLWLLEANTIKYAEIKEKNRRTRRLLETQLFSKNLIKRISTWTVSLVRYSESFLKWTRDKLIQMDQRPRKLTTRLHRQAVFVKKRRKRSRQLWRLIDASTQGCKDYIK